MAWPQRAPDGLPAVETQAESRPFEYGAAPAAKFQGPLAEVPNQGKRRPAAGAPDLAEDPLPRHPSDPLIAGSELLREQWSATDALGNRERAAIYQTELFKYPRLRVVEKWSGKTGDMISRTVMVADHLLVGSRSGVGAARFEKRVAEQGFAIVEAVGESSALLFFGTGGGDPAELPRRIEALAALADVVEFAEPDYLV